MAIFFAYIFNICTPISKYLQTNGLDILISLSMIKKAQSELTLAHNKYNMLTEKAIEFVTSCNKLLEKNTDVDEVFEL